MLAADSELELDEGPSIEETGMGANLSGIRRHWPEFVSSPLNERSRCVPLAAPAAQNRQTQRRGARGLCPTRRGTLIGAMSIALGGVLGIGFLEKDFFADTIFGADLMRGGPLSEEALGEERAPHTVIEYASLTCPHCAHFFEQTFPALKADYIDTGKARFILREFPLDALALGAAVLARAIAPESYFPFVQALLAQQHQWMVDRPLEPLFAIAWDFGLTRDDFRAALSDQRVIAGIDWVRLRAAQQFKVNAAPTFFVDGKMHTGAISLEQLELAMA